MGSNKIKYSRVKLNPISRAIRERAIIESKLKKLGLPDRANYHYIEAKKSWRGALVHAHKCGAALIQAKKILEHGCWQLWLKDNFKGSRELANIYMRIAHNWEHPHLVELRKKGVPLDSIRAVLKEIPSRKSSKKPEPDKIIRKFKFNAAAEVKRLDKLWAEQYGTDKYHDCPDKQLSKIAREYATRTRKKICEKVADELRVRHALEVAILLDNWDECWGALESSMRKLVRDEFKYDPYNIQDKSKCTRDVEKKLAKIVKGHRKQARKSA